MSPATSSAVNNNIAWGLLTFACVLTHVLAMFAREQLLHKKYRFVIKAYYNLGTRASRL